MPGQDLSEDSANASMHASRRGIAISSASASKNCADIPPYIKHNHRVSISHHMLDSPRKPRLRMMERKRPGFDGPSTTIPRCSPVAAPLR